MNLRINEVSLNTIKTELGLAYDVSAIFDFDFNNRAAAGAFRLYGKYYPESRVAIFDPGDWIRQPSGYYAVGMDGLISNNSETYAGKITLLAGCSAFQVSIQR